MAYINIGGRMCVKVDGHYVTLEEYRTMLEIQKLTANVDHSTDIHVDVSLISNKHPHHLSREEVLDVFVQYVHKYRGYCSKFAIPLGTKYRDYSEFLMERMHYAFPTILWGISYETQDKIVFCGEKE